MKIFKDILLIVGIAGNSLLLLEQGTEIWVVVTVMFSLALVIGIRESIVKNEDYIR